MLFDVVEVDIRSGVVLKFMGERKTASNAEAIVKMAAMRRGVEKSFYAPVPAGKYIAGQTYGEEK
jgi:hypothetical protein